MFGRWCSQQEGRNKTCPKPDNGSSSIWRCISHSERGFSIDILVFSSVAPLFLYLFSSCWQVLFEDSLSTVWSAPNYCISEWHFPSWQGGREQWMFHSFHTPPKKEHSCTWHQEFSLQKGNSELKNHHWVVVSKFFIFTPKFGEDEPILTSIFFRWVEVETTNYRSETIMIFRKSKSTKLCRISVGNRESSYMDHPKWSTSHFGWSAGGISRDHPYGSSSR